MTTEELQTLADLLADRITGQLEHAPEPELVDAKTAAQLLSVPATWLLAEAREDRIPHKRLGKYVRFRPHDLTAWLDTKGNR